MRWISITALEPSSEVSFPFSECEFSNGHFFQNLRNATPYTGYSEWVPTFYHNDCTVHELPRPIKDLFHTIINITGYLCVYTTNDPLNIKQQPIFFHLQEEAAISPQKGIITSSYHL